MPERCLCPASRPSSFSCVRYAAASSARNIRRESRSLPSLVKLSFANTLESIQGPLGTRGESDGHFSFSEIAEILSGARFSIGAETILGRTTFWPAPSARFLEWRDSLGREGVKSSKYTADSAFRLRDSPTVCARILSCLGLAMSFLKPGFAEQAREATFTFSPCICTATSAIFSGGLIFGKGPAYF